MASIFGKRLASLTNSYPSALDEVRDLFDLTIIRDLEEREGSKAPARLELGLRSWRTRGAHSWHPPFPDDAREAGGQYAVVDATEWV